MCSLLYVRVLPVNTDCFVLVGQRSGSGCRARRWLQITPAACGGREAALQVPGRAGAAPLSSLLGRSGQLAAQVLARQGKPLVQREADRTRILLPFNQTLLAFTKISILIII